VKKCGNGRGKSVVLTGISGILRNDNSWWPPGDWLLGTATGMLGARQGVGLVGFEMGYAGQLVPLNNVTTTTQVRGHCRYAVNARQLIALLRTLIPQKNRPGSPRAISDDINGGRGRHPLSTPTL